MPADPDPNSGVYQPLYCVVRHHRDAPCAVLRLDSRFICARSTGAVAGLRPHRLDRAGDAADRQRRHLAAHHGHDDVFAAKAEPTARRSDAGQDIHAATNCVHLLARPVPSRVGDLLGMEQHAVDWPAMADYASHGRRCLGTINKRPAAKWSAATDQDQTFDR